MALHGELELSLEEDPQQEPSKLETLGENPLESIEEGLGSDMENTSTRLFLSGKDPEFPSSSSSSSRSSSVCISWCKRVRRPPSKRREMT